MHLNQTCVQCTPAYVQTLYTHTPPPPHIELCADVNPLAHVRNLFLPVNRYEYACTVCGSSLYARYLAVFCMCDRLVKRASLTKRTSGGCVEEFIGAEKRGGVSNVNMQYYRHQQSTLDRTCSRMQYHSIIAQHHVAVRQSIWHNYCKELAK